MKFARGIYLSWLVYCQFTYFPWNTVTALCVFTAALVAVTLEDRMALRALAARERVVGQNGGHGEVSD